MNKLTIETNDHPDALSAVLIGDIGEGADFAKLLDTPAPKIVLDLEHVQRINSTGIREWINVISVLEKQGKALEFQRCSLAFVQQLNMVSNVRGHAVVSSIFAPYYCERCDDTYARLVEIEGVAQIHLEPELACPKCRCIMELDDEPEYLLAFLKV
jgi:anti-anti-sigma regulatory factor